MGKTLKLIGSILFSHVGFCFIICGYVVGGAYLMRHIELPEEKERHNESKILAQLVDDHREWTTERVIQYCISYPDANVTEAVAYIDDLLTKYHETVAYARNRTATYGVQAYRGRNDYNNETYGWSVPSSVLFTATILSTVGYGHIYPVTQTGYLICMLYSVFAIPLMSMFLVSISGALMTCIRILFNGGCCFFLHRKRRQQQKFAFVKENSRMAWNPVLSNECPSGFSTTASRVQASQYNDYVKEPVPGTLSLYLFLGYFSVGVAAWYTATASTAHWSFIESAYFNMVTLLTIGFGDYVPGWTPRVTDPDPVALACCAVYIVVGSSVLTTAVGLLFEALQHRKKLRKRFPEKRSLIREHGLYDQRQLEDAESLTPPHTH